MACTTIIIDMGNTTIKRTLATAFMYTGAQGPTLTMNKARLGVD